MTLRYLFFCGLLNAAALPALAQDSNYTGFEGEDEDEVVATGQRVATSVDTVFTPELEFNAGEIRGIGASSIGDLLEELAPELSSGSGRGDGRPVVLVNGYRIGSFREIRDYPPEAIRKMEVFPEETALEYGYSADQKVVNIILRPRFRALTLDGEVGGSTEGGGAQYEGQAGQFRIRRDERWTLSAKVTHQEPIFEDERDVERNTQSPFRTLLSENTAAEFSAAYERPVSDTIRATLSASFDAADTLSNTGESLDNSGQALRRDRQTRDGEIRAGLRHSGPNMTWNSFASISRSSFDQTSQRRTGADNLSVRNNTSVKIGGLARWTKAELFGRRFRPSLSANLDVIDQSSQSDGQRNNLNRENAQIKGTASYTLWEGEDRSSIALNMNAGLSQNNQFDQLGELGLGFVWRPNAKLRIITSFSEREFAPSLTEIGDPLTIISNRRVIDSATGQSVFITGLSGGNPNLTTETQDVSKISLRYKPWPKHNLTLNGDVTLTQTDQPIETLRLPLSQVEAILPERFLRDGTGTLTQYDARPFNAFQSERLTANWALRYNRRVNWLQKPVKQGPKSGETTAQTETSAPRTRGGRQGGGRPGGRNRGGERLSLTLRHDWLLRDELSLAPDLEPIDFTATPAQGRRRGGSEHKLSLRAQYNYHGTGARLTTRWQSAQQDRFNAQGLILDYGALATTDINLFYTVHPRHRWLEERPWLRNVRFSLDIENIFDQKLDIIGADGITPRGFFGDDEDPQGRTVVVKLRKLLR